MRTLVVTLIAALGVAAGTAAADPTLAPGSAPKAPTLTLDSFTLGPVAYTADDFWCTFNDYGAYFSNYVSGQCPYQNYVATLHWKKSPGATEYDVCVKPVFRDYTPGFACWSIPAPKSGSPAALSMTFDSTVQSLNTFQGTTQVWMVQACDFDPSTNTGPCSQSNTVSADIPWTG
jgi:hypothetical protein